MNLVEITDEELTVMAKKCFDSQNLVGFDEDTKFWMKEYIKRGMEFLISESKKDYEKHKDI